MAKIPSVKVVLINKNALTLKVSIPGTARYKFRNLERKIDVRQWDKKAGQCKKGHASAESINRYIFDERNKVIDAFNEAKEKNISFTPDYISAVLSGDITPTSDFLSFYRAYIDNLKATDKKAKGTLTLWDMEYRCLQTFRANIPFKAITTDFLNDYHRSLMKYAPTTRHKKLKKIRQIIRNAVEQGLIDKKQVAGFEMIKYEHPLTRYLTLEQTEAIGKLIYSKALDKNLTLRTVACYFLIECYAGIRFSDWHRFEIEKLINNRSLKVRAQKNKEPIYLPLNVFRRLGKIIDYTLKHNIEFDLSEKTTNEMLKVLGGMIGLPFAADLSTHDGRRTCGTLLGEMGYNTREIADVLGISETTARIYVKMTKQSLKNAFERNGGL